MTLTHSLHWQYSGYDSMLPVQGMQVQSLVGQLGSHMYGAAKNKRMVFTFLNIYNFIYLSNQLKAKYIYIYDKDVNGLQSLKYLLPGLLQERFASPVLIGVKKT